MLARMLVPTERIESAYRQIDAAFKGSPHFVSEALSDLTGTTILVKDETRNPIGSFKGRGASWWMACHPEAKQIVCASAGNFGLGIAFTARDTGCHVHVFVASTANRVKVEAIGRLGSHVHVHVQGDDFDAAKEAARAFAEAEKLLFVEDGRDVEITEGAGTIGIELARYRRGVDIVFVPIGNGALAGGVGSYLKSSKSGIRIVGVCAERAPAMAESWKSRRLVTTRRADTVADGIAVRNPVPAALDVLADAVDEIVLVSDESIKAAMQLLYRLEGIVAEPAGAASLAGLLKSSNALTGKTAVTLICGANIDQTMRESWLGRT